MSFEIIDKVNVWSYEVPVAVVKPSKKKIMKNERAQKSQKKKLTNVRSIHSRYDSRISVLCTTVCLTYLDFVFREHNLPIFLPVANDWSLCHLTCEMLRYFTGDVGGTEPTEVRCTSCTGHVIAALS